MNGRHDRRKTILKHQFTEKGAILQMLSEIKTFRYTAQRVTVSKLNFIIININFILAVVVFVVDVINF